MDAHASDALRKFEVVPDKGEFGSDTPTVTVATEMPLPRNIITEQAAGTTPRKGIC